MIALAAGCQSTVRAYDGPARPADEVVSLVANPTEARVAFHVTAVNDRAVDVHLDTIAMLPGTCALRLVITPTTLLAWEGIHGQQAAVMEDFDNAHTQDMSLTFTASAGARYALNGQMNTDTNTTEIWVYDEATGERLETQTAP
jgi:hypothetical protein